MFPLIASKMFTKSSGVDVPNDTTISPIISCDTFHFLASEEAPFISRAAPFTKKINPSKI